MSFQILLNNMACVLEKAGMRHLFAVQVKQFPDDMDMVRHDNKSVNLNFVFMYQKGQAINDDFPLFIRL